MTTTMQNSPWTTKAIAITAGLLTVQFAAAYLIGSGHLLVNAAGVPLPPIAITAVIPVTGFLAAYVFSPRLREFVLAQDLRTLTMMQLWRVIGFVFLPLYSFGVLPGLFAWPAGVGDVAVGLAAFAVVSRIDRDPNYVTTSGFLAFHTMGLIDFAAAITTSALAAGAFPALIPGGVTSAALDVWPLNIFPSFIVPAFIILHLSVFFKVRELRRLDRQHTNRALLAA